MTFALSSAGEREYTKEQVRKHLILIEDHVKAQPEDVCVACIAKKHLLALEGYAEEGLTIVPELTGLWREILETSRKWRRELERAECGPGVCRVGGKPVRPLLDEIMNTVRRWRKQLEAAGDPPAEPELRVCPPGYAREDNWCVKIIRPLEEFDPRSIRVVKPKPDVLIRVGCPKGEWDADRGVCRVGTKAHSEWIRIGGETWREKLRLAGRG